MISELDRMAWSIVIGRQEDMKLAAAAADCRQLTGILDSHAADVLLVDEELLHACDARTLDACASRRNSCRVILVSMHQPDYSMERSQYAFVSRRLLKGISASDLLNAIRASELNTSSAPKPGSSKEALHK